ncbi:hypothetical protein C8Q80DRAFT_1167608 [Daedaleopsis nitida]|nr:hypothetical protein C8Q80DRAFT_1167608 [Daedaleopsis nitida]
MAAFNPVMSMAPISEAQRPAMRRKSSAQNLLASFKSNNNNSSGGAPPSSFPTGPVPSAGLPYATALPTPTTATMPREWDVQSLQSDGVGSSAGTSLQTNGSLPQGTSVDVLRELVKKRIITLTYLRNVHEGRSHWFHTIMITRTELDRTFPNAAMKQRTYRFAVLGMALANQFDVKDPQDLLRGLSNVLSEYELLKEDSDRPKIRLFRGAKGSKRPVGAADYALSSTDPSEAYMSLPHVPFPLDYHQTLLSLLDVLSELYNKISKILGPSPFSGQNMMGPLGLLSPHPGVSYLFSGAESASVTESDGSLWGIAHATMLGSAGGGSSIYNGGPGSPPPSWTSSLGDTVRQIDNKLKKLIALLLKELDDCARAGIKDELASLDPLLRHVSVADEHRDTFEFD